MPQRGLIYKITWYNIDKQTRDALPPTEDEEIKQPLERYYSSVAISADYLRGCYDIRRLVDIFLFPLSLC